MTHAARLLASIAGWLKAGPLGDTLRPAEYRALISCGFNPALQHAGDIGDLRTSCAIFLRAIYHDSGVMPAKKPGKSGWPMWGGPNADGWLGTLGPRHPSAHKWSAAMLAQVGPGWMLYIESATDAYNNHVYMLVERVAEGTVLPEISKVAGPHTWKVAQGGGGDGTRCAYGYRELTDTSGRPILLTFDPERIGHQMILVPKALRVGDIGFDTIQKLTAAQAQTLAAAGLKFGVRYVPLSSQSPSVGISKTELDALIGAGLSMMLVQFGRTGGWSVDVGHADGETAAKSALALGYPPSACLWLDLASPGSDTAAIAYANSWYKGAVAGGMQGSALGIYCEPGVPLTASQLYHKLSVSRYWKTMGRCPDVEKRGYQFLQLYPGNQTIAPGIIIDYGAVQSDFLGSYPVAAAAAV